MRAKQKAWRGAFYHESARVVESWRTSDSGQVPSSRDVPILLHESAGAAGASARRVNELMTAVGQCLDAMGSVRSSNIGVTRHAQVGEGRVAGCVSCVLFAQPDSGGQPACFAMGDRVVQAIPR
jgi:hypothetical protein